MIKSIITLISITLSFSTLMAASSADSSFVESSFILNTPSGDISGKILTPKVFAQIPLALIIAGSGPTDRDGNNPMMKNESLKKLSYELAANNIATVRFDKRGIGESRGAAKNEADLRFEDYIRDAEGWVALLKKDKRFSKIFIIGHSEGSLIGMIAALKQADGFVSIAGPGKSVDKVLKEQLDSQPQMIKDLTFPIIDSLVKGKLVPDVNPMFNALFRQSVQPYMISWFHYDPQIEIQKLTKPVLIIQGTKDIQVSVDDANLLAKANPKAQLIIIKNMNHIFRVIEGDRSANMASYNNSLLPISDELANSIAVFINKS